MGNLHRRGGSPWWRVQWHDARGKLRTRTLKGISDRKLAQAVADKICTDAALEIHGLVSPAKKRLLRAAAEEIETHIADWEEMLGATGASERYVQAEANLVRRVMAAARVQHVPDITPGDLRTAIGRLSRARGTGTLSVRSKNKALRAVQMFLEQLDRDGKIENNPMRHVARWDEATDPRHQHVAYTPDEQRAIIQAARQSMRVICGLTGSQRAMLYELAAGTGFRARTLRGLAVQHLHLEGDEPTITVWATNTKNKKAKEQPITPELARMLQAYVAGMKPGEKIFRPTKRADFHRAMEADVTAAGLSYEVPPASFRDFHSWRATFITNAGLAGGLAIAQDLAGHSTPMLTKRYMRPTMGDYRAALNGLPKPTQDVSGNVAGIGGSGESRRKTAG